MEFTTKHIMLKSIILGLILSAILILSACKKPTSPAVNTNPKLIFVYKMDSTQRRLNNFGNDTPMIAGHWGQNPVFHRMGAHYIEMDTTGLIAIGGGVVLYNTPMTSAGGSSAIDFTQEAFGNSGDTFFSVPISSVRPGNYPYLRVSLAYQNFSVTFHWDTSFTYGGYPVTINGDFPSTIASFIGINTYLTNYTISTQSVAVNGNKAQGYWGAETPITLSQYNFTQTYVETGQAPPGSTTVVNPLFATSPIPAGSCLVTGSFSPSNLVITGKETHDIVVTVSLSTNQSFEWIDYNGNHKWDAMSGEPVVDMGVRGMIPYIN